MIRRPRTRERVRLHYPRGRRGPFGRHGAVGTVRAVSPDGTLAWVDLDDGGTTWVPKRRLRRVKRG